MIETILDLLRTMPLGWLTLILLAENLLLFGLALLIGDLLVRRHAARAVSLPPPPIEALEIGCVVSTLLINTLVTLAGLLLWRADWIRFRTDLGWGVLLDVLLLLLIMDLAMYLLHRVAHWTWIYPYLHQTHHRYDRPRPLTLFVLNPAETFSFGGLWLAVLMLYDFSWLGMSIYLALNLAFGTIGHLGVEPFPSFWPKLPGLGLLAGGSFHVGHHGDIAHNFGFYTLVWDRLFGTLQPDYHQNFGRLQNQPAPIPTEAQPV